MLFELVGEVVEGFVTDGLSDLGEIHVAFPDQPFCNDDQRQGKQEHEAKHIIATHADTTGCRKRRASANFC